MTTPPPPTPLTPNQKLSLKATREGLEENTLNTQDNNTPLNSIPTLESITKKDSIVSTITDENATKREFCGTDVLHNTFSDADIRDSDGSKSISLDSVDFKSAYSNQDSSSDNSKNFGEPKYIAPTEDFITKLLAANKILILGHFNPDGDALGSAAALCHYLLLMGKYVRVGTSGKIPPNLFFLLKPEKLFIEAYFDKYLLNEFDLLIFLDCHGPDRVWPNDTGEDFSKILPPYLVIDHHMHDKDLSGFSALFHDPYSSSTGELVARLIRAINTIHLNNSLNNPIDSGYGSNSGSISGSGSVSSSDSPHIPPLTPPIVEGILAAIVSDTNFFTQTNATPLSLREASFLVAMGGDLEDLNAKLNQSWTLARMKLLHKALKTLELHFRGEVALMLLTQEMLDATGATIEDADGFVEYPRSLTGVKLAAFIKEDGRGQVKVSLRSRFPVNAREIAQCFGGGGHNMAAAYTDKSRAATQAKARFLSKIVECCSFNLHE
jgi:phosphoesterase RecJ-like protein